MEPPTQTKLPYFLGCPVWNCPHWRGDLFPSKTPKPQWLRWYSKTFNTVEGNSTFYALPSLEMAKTWAQSVEVGFQFCFKFPKEISHDLQLRNTDAKMQTFLQFLAVFAEQECLGPTFLQLPPSFSARSFHDLEKFLGALPQEWPWAVELRHQDWFDEARYEERVDTLLRAMNIDRVIFDSRPLYSRPPEDEYEVVSQTRKPKSPLRLTTTGNRPFVRFVGRNRIEQCDEYVAQWTPIVANWIRQGLTPYVFTHTPDDQYAPSFARRFHRHLQSEADLVLRSLPSLAELAPASQSTATAQRQLNLFD